MAKVNGCCAGLPSPASSLVKGSLQSWYEGLSAAVRDGLFRDGEDGRAPGAVCCVRVRGRAGELAGCSVEELGEGYPSSFLKFHLLTGLVGTDLMVEEISMMEGRCCDFGKAVSTQQWVVSSPMFTKARSGLVVVVPQQAERKLRGYLGSSSSIKS